MKIRNVFVDGFRGLPDREFSLVDPRSNATNDLVLVTGKLASGKTSFLEAIVAGKEQVGAYGAVQPDSALIRIGSLGAKVRITWQLSTWEQERYGTGSRGIVGEAIFGAKLASLPEPDPVLSALLSDYVADPLYGKVEYFHAQRRLPLGTTIDLSKNPGSEMDRMSRLSRDDMKYSGLLRFIVEAALGLDVDLDGNPKPPGRIKKAFETLCSTKSLGGLYRSGESMLPAFLDHDRRAYSLAQLSDGELDALLFATTFVRAGISNSVVLIDRPEQYLGPVETRNFVMNLMRLGEDNQFIVATQQTELLAVVQPHQIIQLG